MTGHQCQHFTFMIIDRLRMTAARQMIEIPAQGLRIIFDEPPDRCLSRERLEMSGGDVYHDGAVK
jgi:hypothetical protein